MCESQRLSDICQTLLGNEFTPNLMQRTAKLTLVFIVPKSADKCEGNPSEGFVFGLMRLKTQTH